MLLGLALGIATVEFGLRLAKRLSPAVGLRVLHEARPDRPWLYGLRPGARSAHDGGGAVHYAINAEGFRDRSFSRTKPEGMIRVLVVGDSVAFGFGTRIEETFPKQLESLLHSRRPTEVLNFGVGGYNAYTEAALLADRGLAWQPDLVLVQFSINDLNDPTLHFDVHTRTSLGELPTAAFPDPAQRAPVAPVPAGPWCRTLLACALLDDLRLSRTLRDPAWQAATFQPPLELPPGASRAWLARLYGDMNRRSREVGARFAVLAFPYRPQVYGGVAGNVQAVLGEIGEAGGWPTVDLVPAFRRAARSDAPPLFLDLWHPSAAGHRVAARAIAQAIETNDLLPISAPRTPQAAPDGPVTRDRPLPARPPPQGPPPHASAPEA